MGFKFSKLFKRRSQTLLDEARAFFESAGKDELKAADKMLLAIQIGLKIADIDDRLLQHGILLKKKGQAEIPESPIIEEELGNIDELLELRNKMEQTQERLMEEGQSEMEESQRRMDLALRDMERALERSVSPERQAEKQRLEELKRRIGGKTK